MKNAYRQIFLWFKILYLFRCNPRHTYNNTSFQLTAHYQLCFIFIWLYCFLLGAYEWKFVAPRWQWYRVFCFVAKVRDQLFLVFGLKLRLNWILIAFRAGPVLSCCELSGRGPFPWRRGPALCSPRSDAFHMLLFIFHYYGCMVIILLQL